MGENVINWAADWDLDGFDGGLVGFVRGLFGFRGEGSVGGYLAIAGHEEEVLFFEEIYRREKSAVNGSVVLC